MFKSAIVSVLLIALGGCASSGSVNSSQTNLLDQMEKAYRAYDEANFSKAETLYLRIVEEFPKVDDAWLILGNIYTRQGRLNAAIRCYEQVLKLDSKNGRAWHNLALARVKQAIDALEQGQKIVPIEHENYNSLILLQAKLESRVTQ